MTRPIELNDIYTQVNILEKVIGRRGFNLEQLLQDCNLEDFDRFGLSQIKQKRVPGLEAVNEHDKLMILGKPGVGKTTFLKYLAIQCNRGDFAETKIPIFITLKKFAEIPKKPHLKEYLAEWLENHKVTNSFNKVEQLINRGRGLILLDGLDEVREEDYDRVIREIEACYRLFSNNQFVITCRIAAREYAFNHFTEVEVADFDEKQIKTFVTSWFNIKQLPNYSQHFLEQLKNNLTIKELANSPLLLTLLCLEFEDSGNFPSDRADLYARATNILLRKWDDKRYIYRQQVYKELTPKRKEGLLSQIAFKTFDKKEYFFKQRTIERYIGEYICNLPTAPKEQTELDIDSQAVLKSIEGQHGLLVERARGIYSFSHLTFQEYFTARKIANLSNPNQLETTLINLASHVTENRWREVFLLTVGMLEPADRLLMLMKRKIDQLIAQEIELQKYLMWVRDKSNSVEVDCRMAVIRVFYFELSFLLDFELSFSLDSSFSISYFFDISFDNSLNRDFSFLYYEPLKKLDLYSKNSPFLSLNHNIYKAIENCTELKLKKILEKLQQQLPNLDTDLKNREQWWKDHSEAWIKELREAIIQYRNISHEWNFNQKETELLTQYLMANQLLVDCLNSECYVSREVREKIENTLLLPFADLNYD